MSATKGLAFAEISDDPDLRLFSLASDRAFRIGIMGAAGMCPALTTSLTLA
jgi:hypothetical protein